VYFQARKNGHLYVVDNRAVTFQGAVIVTLNKLGVLNKGELQAWREDVGYYRLTAVVIVWNFKIVTLVLNNDDGDNNNNNNFNL
jgi:hypothetical protein